MIIHKGFGLDLGTTNSTASLLKNGRIVFSEEERSKNKTIPSIVALRNNGQEVVGSAAKTEFYSGNANSKKSVKREMGKKVKITIGNEKLSPEEISAKIIKYCRKCLLDTLGNEPNVVYDRVVITIPAYFNLAQKDATRLAGELAGLKVQMLLEEPTAAAINYAVQNNIEDGLFFVFDLGGGTFDVSILEKTGSVPSVLATAGNNYLGGDNFDMILARYFVKCLKDAGHNIDDVEIDINNSKFRRLMFAAENVKKQLSVFDTYDIYFPDVFRDNSGIELNIENFNRKQFNSLIKEKIETDVIKECDRALEILKEKYGKTIEDITHILMVGGSTKIPYIKEVVKERYCVTEKLKDVISYEPDLSVSAGAAYVANSNGFAIEDAENGILVEMNAPYVIDGMVYLSGKIENGNVSKVGISNNNYIEIAEVSSDGTFIITIQEKEYKENCVYSFYNDERCIDKSENNDTSTVDIIAPTPVQNEDIAVEIIDVEKGTNEKDIIISKGAALPADSENIYKINEYSTSQIILPIWEGPRHIFNLVIDNLPENAKIGTKILVKTSVSLTSDISLEVSIDGQVIDGRYEKMVSEEISSDRFDELENSFNKRIMYVDDQEEKEKLMTQHADLSRELEEARENNDENHYTAVSEKIEKIVSEMPASPVLTDEQFDEIGDYIKSNMTSDLKYTEFDIDNLVFYGKRFIKKGNLEEAQKSMDELLSIKGTVDLFNSPKSFYGMTKVVVLQALLFATQYIEEADSDPVIVGKINKELAANFDRINELLTKYNEDDDCPQMKDDALEMLQLSSSFFQIMNTVSPENSETISMYKGLVSKA